MGRLVFFLDDPRDLRRLKQGSYLIGREAASEIPSSLGEDVVFVRGHARKTERYSGLGRLHALRPIVGDHQRLLLEVGNVVELDSLPLRTKARGHQVMVLTEQEFGQLLKEIQAPHVQGADDIATEDEQEAYRPPTIAPEATLRAVVETVRREVGFRCMVTGQVLPANELRIAIIRPTALGGSLHVNNCLALSREADEAFAAGHFTVRNNYSIIVDSSRIAEALLAEIDRRGRLVLPKNPALRPTSDNLDYHRRFVFGLG